VESSLQTKVKQTVSNILWEIQNRIFGENLGWSLTSKPSIRLSGSLNGIAMMKFNPLKRPKIQHLFTVKDLSWKSKDKALFTRKKAWVGGWSDVPIISIGLVFTGLKKAVIYCCEQWMNLMETWYVQLVDFRNGEKELSRTVSVILNLAVSKKFKAIILDFWRNTAQQIIWWQWLVYICHQPLSLCGLSQLYKWDITIVHENRPVLKDYSHYLIMPLLEKEGVFSFMITVSHV